LPFYIQPETSQMSALRSSAVGNRPTLSGYYYAAPLAAPAAPRVVLSASQPMHMHSLAGIAPALAAVPPIVRTIRMPATSTTAPVTVTHCATAWRDDGSNAVKNLTDGAFTITGKPSKGSPVNALGTIPLTSGQYFEVTCQDGDGPFIGVGKLESFAQGYRCKGLLFGGPGNLSNGSALMKGEFGEQVSKGSVVGILFEMTSDLVTLTVYQDGRCLGPAFTAKRQEKAQLFPLVQAKSDGDTFRIAFKAPPAVRSRESGSQEGFEGSWAIEKMMVGPELGEYPLSTKMNEKPVVLKVTTGPNGSVRMGAKVVNALNFSASSSADASLAPFDALTVNPGISTMMAGPEPMMDAESKLSKGLQGARKWIVSNGQLLINGPTFEISCARHIESFEPVDTEI